MADDEQLLSLLAVAEHGSISAAAEHLHRGQSAISERLRKLTEYVGEPLYAREINGVKLTQAGAALLPDIERLRRVMRDIDSVIARRQRLMEGELNIVSTSLIANYYLPPFLTRYRQQYPGINLYIKSGERYWKDAAAGEVDVFFYEGDNDLPELPDYFENIPWLDNEIVVVTPLHHPLAGRKDVSFEEVESYPIIWREPGSAVRGAIEKEFVRRGIVPRHFIEVADIESVGTMINADLGIGFMSRRVVEQRSDWQVSTATLESHQMVCLNFMAAPQPERRSKMLQKFLELIQVM
ncbi:LysR family transcriptional regulator [Acidithiobacillus montserratensis]|uniref:LysR family transcriptional regulator n=1 Tax=Acidithiobacillus montserratensis TaxID=2729135 RepID=A0ACD5HGA3_9PROT|nr:LysR family transcriptional regulator [Acidithiobacillus montserratensis]MBN2678868.1 LysR family transcriptional regulator [Acidithiobacillaceae bacterium]MBU2748050.1 LysR family transcriptional regulator [Acidithiobacillus montserratensis]